MDYRYARPPPPQPSSMADPHHLQQPPRQPVPPPGPWFSGQFQFHPSQHSPSPPPQWPPPPPPQHSDHLPPPPYHAPPPPPPPYAANPLQQHSHPFSLPPRAPVPPPHSQIPQSYPPGNQDWSNQSWGHQAWDYSDIDYAEPPENLTSMRHGGVHNKEDDWAAKAKAWAAGKAVTETRPPQSQFTPVGRPEDLNHYHDQYLQNVDPHYADVQQQSLPASNYQHYPPTVAPTHRTPVAHMQEASSFSSGYVSDGHLPYSARDGTSAGDLAVAFPHQETSPTSLSVHRQEVPSSYSSVAGNEEAGEQNGKFFQSLHMPFTSAPQHQVSPMSNIGRPVLMEQPHYAYGNQSAEPATDLSDQPLDFAPRFSRDHDPLVQSNYTNESGGPLRGMDGAPAMPSNYAWTPSAAPAGVYSSMPQVDPSVAVPSPIPAHSATLYGRMPGPSFQPTMPSASPTFPIGTGNVYHATASFPGETYGASGVPQNPKKALLPNWLREEVIKKKAVIGSSALEFSKEDTKSNEDEGIDNSLGKGDQADSKSVESSRSMEEEDDDEDYVEAARTAAINQEIKRVLTEVLLKVTDELFDEIATKVVSEDDLSVEVEHNIVASNHTISPPTPGVPTPKASAKVLIPAKTEETELDDVNGKSTSSAPGDVLGLGNYASDEDEDEEIHNDAVPSSKGSIMHQQPASIKLSEAKRAVENGSLQADTNEHDKNVLNEESDPHTISPTGTAVNHTALDNELSHNWAAREPEHVDLQSRYSSKAEYVAAEDKIDDSSGGKELDGSEVSNSKDIEKVVCRTKLPNESLNIKKLVTHDSEGRTTRDGSEKQYKIDSKRSSAGKEFVKDVGVMDKASRKGVENSKSHEERHVIEQRKDDQNGSKEKMKEHGANSGEEAKDSDSRKRSHVDVREDKKETGRDRRTSTKEDNDRKRERSKDEKGERSRHKLASDSSRHKRRRSSSIGSRGRSSKDNSTVSHANDSSDESSDDSRRKVHSKRRNSSPSPVRSRRRHVSRSPHSKHSQRRHSPYSSLESSRKRRSGSRSPVRRRK